jgi:hypothetical protein
MRLRIAGLLAAIAGVWVATAGFAADAAPPAKAPLVVEMFTSKYCPNCPMAESKMKGVAEDNADLLVLFEHVDYWDRSEKEKDPHGLPEITQRQYDYSNTLSKRPGQVFTPMPLIDGQIVASPPLLFSWGSALARGRELPAKELLAVSKDKSGSLNIPLPISLRNKENDIWVMGIEPVEGTKVWRVNGIVQANLKGEGAHLSAAMLPQGPQLLVMVQKPGPGAVLAVGRL